MKSTFYFSISPLDIKSFKVWYHDEEMVIIRNLTIGDYENLILLWERSGLPFKPRGRDSREALKAEMENSPNLHLGAFQGEDLVGSLIASFDGRKGWINRLAVAPEYRERGIANLLVQSAEQALETKGARVIGALILNTNVPSLKFFEKMGYQTDEDIVYVSKRDNTES